MFLYWRVVIFEYHCGTGRQHEAEYKKKGRSWTIRLQLPSWSTLEGKTHHNVPSSFAPTPDAYFFSCRREVTFLYHVQHMNILASPFLSLSSQKCSLHIYWSNTPLKSTSRATRSWKLEEVFPPCQPQLSGRIVLFSPRMGLLPINTATRRPLLSYLCSKLLFLTDIYVECPQHSTIRTTQLY